MGVCGNEEGHPAFCSELSLSLITHSSTAAAACGGALAECLCCWRIL